MTNHAVDFVPATDALSRDADLRWCVELPVLGIDTVFQTNSQYVMDIVEDTFGVWRAVDQESGVVRERVYVRIIVREGTDRGAERATVRLFSPDPTRLIVLGPESVGISDPERRESVAYVTTTFAADREYFRVALLEAITFALLSHFDRHPLHAAAIARGDRVALLIGESGAGKSTLAYLAHSAGIDVLGEDHVWVQLEPTLRVWGSSVRARLGDAATEHFPEAASRGLLSTVDGKTKLVVGLQSAAPGRFVRDDLVVCLLSRTSGEVAVERVDAATVADHLMTHVAPGFDRFPERHERVARALAARGGWRLRLSANPHDALPALRELLADR